MDLYDDSTTVTQAPAVPAAGPNGPGYFTEGTPGSTPATTVRGWWLNGVALEIRNVIVGAGLTPARATFNQLYTAINGLIGTALTPFLSKAAAALTYQPLGSYLTGAQVVFTASTTWTCPAGVTEIVVQVIGAGGGGAGAGASKSGGGGGAGGYASGRIAVVPGTTYTIVVGEGGAAGAFEADGSAGGNSGFAFVLEATGGGGGVYSASVAGGSPGVGSGLGATLALSGGYGTDGNLASTTQAGNGGASMLGGGGRGGEGGGLTGGAPGSGGGGAYSSGPGGAGANGLVIISY